MKHSRHKRSHLNLLKSASSTLPILNKGLNAIGSTTQRVTKDSIPLIEEGVSKVYGTMSSGLDLGIKGAKSFRRMTKKTTGLRSRSRSASQSGGRHRSSRRRRGSRRH